MSRKPAVRVRRLEMDRVDFVLENADLGLVVVKIGLNLSLTAALN